MLSTHPAGLFNMHGWKQSVNLDKSMTEPATLPGKQRVQQRQQLSNARGCTSHASEVKRTRGELRAGVSSGHLHGVPCLARFNTIVSRYSGQEFCSACRIVMQDRDPHRRSHAVIKSANLPYMHAARPRRPWGVSKTAA